MSFLGTVIILLIVVLWGCAYQQITEENIFDFMVDCINTVISSIFHKISHKYLFSVAEYLF